MHTAVSNFWHVFTADPFSNLEIIPVLILSCREKATSSFLEILVGSLLSLNRSNRAKMYHIMYPSDGIYQDAVCSVKNNCTMLTYTTFGHSFICKFHTNFTVSQDNA